MIFDESYIKHVNKKMPPSESSIAQSAITDPRVNNFKLNILQYECIKN